MHQCQGRQTCCLFVAKKVIKIFRPVFTLIFAELQSDQSYVPEPNKFAPQPRTKSQPVNEWCKMIFEEYRMHAIWLISAVNALGSTITVKTISNLQKKYEE